ncbi:hypothetical protein EG68_01973 [Paragonimus skrjabini miyazakii]|uniref:C3H1-type domain-containing protein n=1 Tax=Paragonimus skrjabini miyazakii TaxID=59628 RepID=A0A8S9Z518_9TREM|nr:hypothetical protein EG68_01973 [Paragonimus skrjabini miyazakii]
MDAQFLLKLKKASHSPHVIPHGQRQQVSLQPCIVQSDETSSLKSLTTECCGSADSAPEVEQTDDRQMVGGQNDVKPALPLMTRRKRRQDWCRWPVCEEFRRTGYCHGNTGTSLTSETIIESSCMSAHIRPSDKIPITPEGEVRICFDSMGLLELNCRRPECHFYHPPKPIRDQIVARRHAQYLREKVFRANSHMPSSSTAAFLPLSLPQYGAQEYQHWNVCLPSPTEATAPTFTVQQWQAALHLFLSSWLKMGSTIPVTTDSPRLQTITSSVDPMHILGGPANMNSLVPGLLPNHGVLGFNTHSMLSSPYHPSVSTNQPHSLSANSPIEPQQFVNPSSVPFVPLNLNNLTSNRLGTPCISGFDGGWWNMLFGPQAQTLNWNSIQSLPITMPTGSQQVANCGFRMDSTWTGLPDMLLPTTPYYNQMAMLNKPTLPLNSPELTHLTSSSAGLPFNSTVPMMNHQLASTVPTDSGLILGSVLSNSSSVLTSLHEHLYANANNVNMNTNLSLLPLADQRQSAATLSLTE